MAHGHGDGGLTEEDIARLLEEAPPVETLSPQALRKLIVAFEKKININQELRVKYAAEPERFMESEVDLDEALKELHVLATAPELYADFVKLNAVASLLGLLLHDNHDIAIDAVELLKELTEPDAFAEYEEATTLLDSFFEHSGLEMLISNMERLSEEDEEDKRGIFQTLAIVENLTETRPETCSLLFEKTGFLSWALRRIKGTPFDENKAYCCELLSICLQLSPSNRQMFVEKNGMDVILVSLAGYRKQNPPSADEEELVENYFDCLCSLLLHPPNKDAFREAEGIELMLIMIKAKRFCRRPALKVLDYALSGNKANCTRFVSALGLKTLFAAFMKKGAKNKNRKGFNEVEDDEHIASCIASLFKQLDPTSEYFTRLARKFEENNFQKVERLVELHLKYKETVESFDRKLEEEKEQRRRELDEEDEEDELDEEYYLSRRLDEGHLFTLQLVDLIVAFLMKYGSSAAQKRLAELLQMQGANLSEIKAVLLEHARHIGSSSLDEEEGEEKEEEGEKGKEKQEAHASQREKEQVLRLAESLEG
ncbi:Beta-catenin-like protein 1 [Balamuthia mandrillaris]